MLDQCDPAFPSGKSWIFHQNVLFQNRNGTIEDEELSGLLKDLMDLGKKVEIDMLFTGILY